MSGPIDFLRNAVHTAHEAGQQVARFAHETADNVENAVGQGAKTIDDVTQAAKDVGSAVKQGAAEVGQQVREEGVINVGKGIIKHEAGQMQRVLTELQHRSPEGFAEWLLGPEGPKVSDFTSQIPGLQKAIGDVLDKSMQNPLVAGAVGKAFGFEYNAEGDFYTTNESSMQSHFGFHEIYDKAGKPLGMDLDTKVAHVTVDGVDYKLQLWKGSYGSGGAYGGEIGFYTRGNNDRGPLGNLLEKIPGYYSAATGENQPKMTQEIVNNSTGASFKNEAKGADDPDGKHYWNLAIRTDPGARHDSLTQKGSIEFKSPQLASAMCEELKRQGVDAKVEGNVVSYEWT